MNSLRHWLLFISRWPVTYWGSVDVNGMTSRAQRVLGTEQWFSMWCFFRWFKMWLVWGSVPHFSVMSKWNELLLGFFISELELLLGGLHKSFCLQWALKPETLREPQGALGSSSGTEQTPGFGLHAQAPVSPDRFCRCLCKRLIVVYLASGLEYHSFSIKLRLISLSFPATQPV